ncbi:MAG TPA: 4-alpha-glucanotransferase [Opitutaceae bacterium]|nr:4-alpha-glucanotransferase [Opitutaceae bacterium]
MAEPLYSWLKERQAGVLMHPTSLPGSQGVGTLDQQAVTFLEFLAAAGFKSWQLCPLGPTGYGDSPYQCFSAFAGNPYLIDLEALIKPGLLKETDLTPLRALPADRVDFGWLYQTKWPALFQAHARFVAGGRRAAPYGDFDAFRQAQRSWLPDYALFSALKGHFGGQPWWQWPTTARTPAAARKSTLPRQLAERVEAYEFIQYLFFGQWQAVRAAARKLGISIIGDTPIFAALDSADVWANPQLFQLDPKTSQPTAVAGCPPDYFSADGQLWGNPLYDWPVHAKSGYAWWLDRLRTNFALCDIVRIDHFRGFESYWSIPAGSPNARPGKWVPGPGLGFFRAVQAALPDVKLIAEDLGTLTPEVLALRDATGLPGMAVLQFAFGGDNDNFYLPHNHRANCVVYPGTHDNDTTRGWYATADEKTCDHVRRYFRVSGQDINWDLLRAAYASVCALAVIPLPDLLGLGSEARFNSPGKPEGNWSWRYRADDLATLQRSGGKYLLELAGLYRR